MNEKKEDAIVLAPANLPDALNLRTLATEMLNSDFFKGIQKAPQAMAIILHGHEIGITPTVALQTISIVNGRMCISTTVLQALFQKRGGRIEVVERTDKKAVVEFSRPGWKPYKHEYTMEDAKAEQLWSKDNWVKRPKTMLLYRAISGGLRVYDPGSFLGVVTTEEAEDYPNGFPDDAAPIVETSKAPDKALEAPKVAPPTSDASPKAEKAAKASPDASTGKKQAIPKASAAPKVGFELSAEEDEPVDDIAAATEHAESKSDEDILVDSIKAALEAEKVDVKKFKAWLFDFQKGENMKLHSCMVVKLGPALRFHGAVHEDLEYLKSQLGGAVKVFRHYTGKDKEKKA